MKINRLCWYSLAWLGSFWLAAMPVVMASSEERLVLADTQGDWGLLAPFLHAARGPGYVYTSFVFDTLVWKDEAGQLQPALASSWHHDAASQCYQFDLNPAARWHDGQPVTAEDVAFSFDYLAKHHYRFVDLGSISQVQVHNQQVSVCLNQPYAPFMTNIAGSLPILPRHIYQSVEAPRHFHDLLAVTGSGPYRLVDYNRARGYYRLVRHADYHLGRPRYAEVLLVKMTPNVALAAMQRGEVDAISLPHQFVAAYRDAGFAIAAHPSNHPVRLSFNHQQLFHAAVLRQGLAHLLDRQQLVDVVYQGQASLARPGYLQDRTDPEMPDYAHDPAQGAVLLQAGGWTRNAQGQWQAESQTLTLRLLANPGLERLARAVAAQLEAAGFDISLRLEPDVQLTERLQQGDYDLALLSASHEGDPDRFRMLVLGLQQRGDAWLDNDRLLALLEQQQGVLDPDERMNLLQAADRLYVTDLPALSLVNPMNFAAYRAERVQLGFTAGGVALGIPLPLNKTSLFFDPR